MLELFKERFKSYNKVVCICALIISYSYVSANEELDDSLENQGLKASRFMPLNKPNLRVKIPQFKNGELDCVIKADEMTRVDDENVKIPIKGSEFSAGFDMYANEDATIEPNDKAMISTGIHCTLSSPEYYLRVAQSLTYPQVWPYYCLS